MQAKLIGLAVFVSVNVLGLQRAEAITVPGNYPTIQAAINAVMSGAAPNGSVIDVQPGIYHEALVIDTVPGSVTVRGVGGAASTIVDASGSGRPALQVFRAPGALRFEGLTFTGGTGGPGTGGGFTFEDASPVVVNVVFDSNTGISGGGGVLSRSNAQFIGCRISNNAAAQFGGGVVISTGSRPLFTNCQIVNNVSGVGGPGVGNIGSGGGVHTNDASPIFRGCVISGNQSKFGGGGILQIGVFGSAYGPAVLVLEDTEVSNNVSSRYSAADNPAEGGGVHIEDNTIAYLIRAHISGNSANTGGGLNGYRARYEISSSIIEFNHAPDPLNVGGFGGGIGMSSNNVSVPFRQASSLLLKDSVVRNNDARAGGGILLVGDEACGFATCDPATAPRASMQIVDSLIDSNVTSFSAGGMRTDRADVTISNSQILRNSVAANGASYGGGLLFGLGSNVTISGTTIARNSAGNFGGGLFVDDSTVISLTNSQVYANTAASGGGMYVGNIGPPSGTVQGTTIADNGTYQIHEQACSPLQRTILNYQSNVITPKAGQTDLYFSTCGGATTSISAFNALPSGRASGNVSSAPSFTTFLATPDVRPSVLSWVVARASSVTIPGVGTSPGDVGTADVAPTTFTTYTLGAISRSVLVPRSWGGSSDTPLVGDFDGDGKKDLAVYRGATGEWFILGSSVGFRTYNWGVPALGDIPVPADYDGDGKTDIAVFRQATGEWFILGSSVGFRTYTWGAPALGDIPVPADYDGDGKADIAVYRQTSGQWFISRSSNGGLQVAWGVPSLGDVPIPADYDGDGKADIAVYRSSTGAWYLLRSTAGFAAIAWGAPGDTPVAADYDGDGKADIAVARPLTGQWFILGSLGGVTIDSFGYGDSRVPGDFDGVGRAEMAIWRAASGSWLVHP